MSVTEKNTTSMTSSSTTMLAGIFRKRPWIFSFVIKMKESAGAVAIPMKLLTDRKGHDAEEQGATGPCLRYRQHAPIVPSRGSAF